MTGFPLMAGVPVRAGLSGKERVRYPGGRRGISGNISPVAGTDFSYGCLRNMVEMGVKCLPVHVVNCD
jgi:hypothetical protein